MIESIQDLTDIELRVAVMGITGYSISGIAECLKIPEDKVNKTVNSINKKCARKNFAGSLFRLTQLNII